MRVISEGNTAKRDVDSALANWLLSPPESTVYAFGLAVLSFLRHPAGTPVAKCREGPKSTSLTTRTGGSSVL